MPDFAILTNNIDMYLEGFKYTVVSSVIALIGSFILGVVLAIMRIAPIRILNWLGTAFVEFVRNIPLVLIAFIFYFALPVVGITLNGFVAGTVTLTVYTAAFIGSHSRWYFISRERPNGGSTFFRIDVYASDVSCRFTPSDENCNPSSRKPISQLSKNSSILGIIAGADLMYQGDLISTKTFVTFDVYIFVGMFYLILTIPLSMLVRYLEKRLAKEAV